MKHSLNFVKITSILLLLFISFQRLCIIIYCYVFQVFEKTVHAIDASLKCSFSELVVLSGEIFGSVLYQISEPSHIIEMVLSNTETAANRKFLDT